MASNSDTFPTDGLAYQMSHPWQTVWAFINNVSAVSVTVTTDQGQSLTVPGGAGMPWSLPMPTRTLIVKSATASAGGLVYITASDSLAGAQSYASNIIAGTVNANILNSNLNVTASGTVSANILNSSINANIQNASLAVTDSLVETNTTIISGLLPKNIAAFSLGTNGQFDQAISAAISGFGLVLNIVDGFLSVWYTASGQDVYQIYQHPFLSAVNSTNGLERIFDAPIPAAATLHVKIAMNQSGLTGVLKW